LPGTDVHVEGTIEDDITAADRQNDQQQDGSIICMLFVCSHNLEEYN